VRARLIFDAALGVLVSVAVFVAALPALRAYQAPDATVVLAIAAVAPMSIAFVVGRLLRASAAVSFAASMAGLLVLLLAAGGLQASRTYHDLIEGPNRILTETLPLVGGLAAISALLVLTWVAGALAGELLARADVDRSPPALPLAVPVVLFVVSFGAAVPAPHRDNAAGPVVFVLLAGAAVVRHFAATWGSTASTVSTASSEHAEQPRVVRRFRPFAIGLAAAVAVTAAVWAVTPDVPALAARPAAVHRTPPIATPVVTEPLDSLAVLRDGTPRTPAYPVLAVDLAQRSTGYLQLAVLDSYDGGLWRFSATFQPTGGRIPGPTGLLSNQEVAQQVTVLGSLPVPLLPALDRPAFVSGLAVAMDPSTGMLLPERPSGGETSYTVVSDAPDVTLGSVPAADAIGTSATSDDVAIPPDTAAALATTARFVAGLTNDRPGPAVSFLQAAEIALHNSDRRVDPSLASTSAGSPAHLGGTSLSEVINAVTVDRAATPEQFATFFAMLARYVGVPARVVTGFRIGASSGSSALPAGRYKVTNRQAWAWVEIPIAGVGWVIADPTPDRVTAVATPPPESVQAPSTTLPPRQATAVPRASILGGHALAPAARIKVPKSHPIPAWAIFLMVLGGLIAVVLLAGPGRAATRRWWRRRARRSQDPSEMAVGAWLELLDGLSRAGLNPDPGSTSREVASEAAGCFGPELREPVAEVGSVAEQAVFAPSHPPDSGAARHAWDVQTSVCRQVRRSLPARNRVRASVLVGSTPRRPVMRSGTQPAGQE
jgi:hypothetical protein